MTDRELLELAASASGIKAIYDENLCVFRDCTGRHPMMNFSTAPLWNPLTDDGDALRLAVKLRLALLFPMTGETYPRVGAGQVGSPIAAKTENAHPDPYAATRRAIVRAAAEIGRAM